ncbi:acyltransferase family protein [Pengzhenrongella sicca]|uniref:Acyltransferase n=1 Tax=Pengzhenrongella sicca TaxID=2819238 RepID=A0A8A4Z7Q9_9MICO|nr:acyltransferase family protein [Pengzhenrongella sicca]QTE27882.1 acyltransferase [Pengzhenrongella sicca]
MAASTAARPARPATARPAPGQRPPATSFRRDIQGLRAIAVLLVVLDHAGIVELHGGYVGVDVFFVLSGFLITGLLLQDAGRTGRVSFQTFYARRAWRILPAATLVLVVTGAATYLLLNYVRAAAVLRDIVWAAFFGANIRFAQVGTDYFAADTPASPVQHFWSLAVEEQFYLVWPVLLAAVLFATHRRRRVRGSRHRDRPAPVPVRAVLAVLVVVIGASLAWSVLSTESSPASAYFSTFARGWELGVGALLATLALVITRIPTAVRVILSWAGLAGILVAAVVYDPTTPFPGWAALLPVLATAAVVASGIGGAPRFGAGLLLGTRPFTYVGDISYSLYLWHFPVLVIAAAYVGRGLTLRENLLLVGLAIVLSAASYRWFEDPLRRARPQWLTPRDRLLLWPASISVVLVFTSLATSAVWTDAQAAQASAYNSRVAAAGTALEPTPEPTQTVAAAPATPSEAAAAAVAASVEQAAADAPLPALNPDLLSLADDVYYLGGCSAYQVTTNRICRLGDPDGDRTMVVFGSSKAQNWMPALDAIGARAGITLIPFIKEACTDDEMAAADGIGAGDCSVWADWAAEQIQDLHPEVIVFAGNSGVNLANLDDFRWTRWDTSVAAILASFSGASDRIVSLADVPILPTQPGECLLARDATLGTCTFDVQRGNLNLERRSEKQALDAEVQFQPTSQWFCASGKCPVVVGSTIAYRDQVHVTATYSTQLADALESSLGLAAP